MGKVGMGARTGIRKAVHGSVLDRVVGERCPCKDGILSRDFVFISHAPVINNHRCSGVEQHKYIILQIYYLEIRSLNESCAIKIKMSA